ncbi:GspE/PulE family protein [Sphingobacterium haloxyli]|uniref:Type II/IV secretion system protein n=1 Tax=Sphingobacterium haloxyli TaxID=2100533 RepID=A0A2S9IWS5_9SPHI|nr:GspE/PulE family protein [Sphingobacterium haloxyli]PRD44968.1 type II/IV secretion system protein [Sphingobacterium haloxyli]
MQPIQLPHTIDETVVKALPRSLARHYRIIAVQKEGDSLLLLTDQEFSQLEDELRMVLEFPFRLVRAEEHDIEHLLQRYYYDAADTDSERKIQSLAFDNNFLDSLIWEAKQLKSSDIHIESFENRGRVRIRIDGMMVERYSLSKTDYPALVNKIKIMSNMDIAEKRLPQDGRIHYQRQGEQFDIRVSVLPTLHGEKVVLRLLNNNAADIQIESLGMSEADLANYLHGVKKPNGILLISGPTGSGKTTTLYATLKYLNKDTTNILTIEDPIEYTLEGINQVQLRENIGLTFGAALRTFLRQDPDIIMVGEIRDPDTANMAIRAALTGHLVLSTIHTNSAWGTISRLIDMGIPGFLIANTLNTTVAQRLVRLLCPACKRIESMDTARYPKQFRPYYEVTEHAVATGCSQCHYTGFKGRKAVYEIVPLDRELAEEIRKENMQVEHLLKERQIKTLGENAFELFAQKLTTLEEIYPLLFNY